MASNKRRARLSVEVLEARDVPAFATAGTFSSGAAPSAVALGDLNNDGKLDMVVANRSADSVSIFLGDGTGKFADLPVTYLCGKGPNEVVIADFNGDGHLDFATVNFADSSISVFLNDGSPNTGFGRTDYPSVIGGPKRLAVGDFNNDGRPDLLVTGDLANDKVAEFLNTGNGAFAYFGSFTVAAGPTGIVVADFNGDGNLDFAVANSQDNSIALCTGKGDGTFNSPRFLLTDGRTPADLAAGDFNGDGRPDLAVLLAGTNTINILFNDSQASFSKRALVYLEGDNSHPFSIRTADLNGDGKFDLAMTNFGTDKVSVLLANGQGGFVSGGSYDVGRGPIAVAAGDLNDDGRIDLVAVNAGSQDGMVLLNQPDPPAPSSPPASPTPGSDITASLTISLGKARLTRTGRYRQTLTLRNVSGQTIRGPLAVLLDRLSRKAKLRGAAGKLQGSPFVVASPGSGNVLSPGEALTVVLEFVASSPRHLRYSARVLTL